MAAIRWRALAVSALTSLELVALFEALADGYEVAVAFAEAGLDAERRPPPRSAALEMGGYVRRQAGGRYCPVA